MRPKREIAKSHGGFGPAAASMDKSGWTVRTVRMVAMHLRDEDADANL